MSKGSKKIARTATEALKVLWEGGFFKGPQNYSTIVGCLSKLGNHFSDPELGMALKRAKHLTRRGKRGSYEYIQKYPYVEEAKAPKRRK